MAEATKLGPCQVRSNTGNPCPRRAEVEILGVAFCGPCAHEQEAYFAIGELTGKEARNLRSESLTEALERTRRAQAGSTRGVAAQMHHGGSGVRETKRLALRGG